MSLLRRPVLLLVLAVGLVAPATALAVVRLRSHGRERTMPSSRTSQGISEVGALFANATTSQHDCTAGVIASSSGDVLITAAHCVVGSGKGMVFVPAFHDGDAPYGRWTVTAVHVAAAWSGSHDAEDDVAFLTVAPRTINGTVRTIQSVTGAYRLGLTAQAGTRITVTGYPAGENTAPITCTTTVYETDGYPSFNCRGYVGGTSGSPWIEATAQGPVVVGIIGGLHEGGCVDYTSYSPILAVNAERQYARATADAVGDIDTESSGDGC